MGRYLRLIGAFLRLNLIGLMEYKADFLIQTGVHAFFQASSLVFFGLLWGRVGGFGGFAPKEMLFLIGTFTVSDSIFSIFTFFGILNLPGVIKDGTLDFFLVKPVSPQFYATFCSPSLVVVLDLCLGFVLIAVALGSGEVAMAPSAWIGWSVLVLAGTAISYSLGVILMSLSFLTLSAKAVWAFYGEFTEVSKYPIGIFPQPWRTVYTVTLPVILVANVPVRFALSRAGPMEIAWFVAVSGILVFASTRFFRFGLKRYQSASS